MLNKVLGNDLIRKSEKKKLLIKRKIANFAKHGCQKSVTMETQILTGTSYLFQNVAR